ncbi:unnamed protein product [Adineta steineri]|uniref:DUF4476 domain-containing protein n=1 Tax=Adineta steineri TaxID=433720 RepID=A0A815WKZ5_9BILA|nr:unnamed protein product [Adineta steineri]CAF1547305.1 unnamed protein product [Adineta steineri]
MDSNTFKSLVNRVKSEDFDDDKASAIKTTVQTAQRISAAQMAYLLKLISFEDTQLDVAKAGYKYTADPDSYGNTVGGVFSFSDAKEELNAYIRQNPHPPPTPSVVHIHHFH